MPQNIDQLKLEDENDLQELVDNQVPGSKTIDYKQSLTGNTDSNKKKFFADVSSFANAIGGYLIYGMRENSGIASDLCGLENIDVDVEIRRLENIMKQSN
jgi:predicted HTH transcriptional regulator